MKTQILIVDFGSQYTSIIGRTLTGLGFCSVTVTPEQVSDYLTQNKPKAIILSGGDASVYDTNAPTVSKEIFSREYFVLGICYGMQLMAHLIEPESVISGTVEQKGYGKIEISKASLKQQDVLFAGLSEKMFVWASHGDVVSVLPDGFMLTAFSILNNTKVIEAIQHDSGRFFGVQFHPEVADTENGHSMLRNFLNHAGCMQDWIAQDSVAEIRNKVLTEIGDGKAFIGVSGGVDSTTLAALLSPVLGDRLYACFIDHGGMRKGEVSEVVSLCESAGIKLYVVDAAPRFFEAIGREIDPEQKRKKFQVVYEQVFNEVIAQNQITHILQGTLATDLIESGSKGKSALIKTHHNVGLKFNVPEIQPFSELFKYQVRDISRSLGLHIAISGRKPFPGPGLYLRVLGIAATPETVEIVRFADSVTTSILEKESYYPEISQVIVALVGVETVGIKGDTRSLGYSVVIRTVKTVDFMTVKGYFLPADIMEQIISEICKHPSIVRVWFDYTPKPPATTEFQ